ncbi:hypothetical protein BDY21DRAFT_55383 [Lineolata rhizophorae]|uniref:Uncharacterized protein n=1 Tax=Lineolata rhizophorae TaxID=578093 RepID=A0A6A6NWH8_9PEZI|nr:hypothetical protein BDY21DRAFT_55383 [Lineolata rhizophorae]
MVRAAVLDVSVLLPLYNVPTDPARNRPSAIGLTLVLGVSRTRPRPARPLCLFSLSHTHTLSLGSADHRHYRHYPPTHNQPEPPRPRDAPTTADGRAAVHRSTPRRSAGNAPRTRNAARLRGPCGVPSGREGRRIVAIAPFRTWAGAGWAGARIGPGSVGLAWLVYLGGRVGALKVGCGGRSCLSKPGSSLRRRSCVWWR